MRSRAKSEPFRLSDAPEMYLRHGQVIWLLTELGCNFGASRNSVHEYLKALRKLGIPFGRVNALTTKKRRRAEYSYTHIMELVIVSSLRVYYTIPDALLKEIIRHRRRLNSFYKRAYVEHHSNRASVLAKSSKDGRSVKLRGLYLDLDIKFSIGQLQRFGPPRLLTPYQALLIYRDCSLADRTFFPTNLSALTEQVVRLARAAPVIRTGPPATTGK
jgi:hypothetical protein